MKVLADFAASNGLILVPIRFNFQGIRLRMVGYDLCRTDGGIVITAEPTNRYDGAKWYLTSELLESDALNGNRHKRAYVKRITSKVLSQFPLTGHAYCKNIEVK